MVNTPADPTQRPSLARSLGAMPDKWILTLLTSIGLLVAACGGSSTTSGPSGKQLFAQDCSACHSLTGVQSPARQGGDLLHANFGRTALLQFAREMPVRQPLS